MANQNPFDVAVIGAGAAGLSTAIFAARANPTLRIALLDGAKKLGAKILVSGGGRCNVTNATVTPADFHGKDRNAIRRILSALPVKKTVEFFREIGVELYEDYAGKLFPTTDSARTILDALLAEARGRGVNILTDHRVTAIEITPSEPRRGGPASSSFTIVTAHGDPIAERLVLSTGGRSLPKTGSDGLGYEFAGQLGHSINPTTPALVPLTLEGEFHKPLSGIAHDVELRLRADGAKPMRVRNALLWTHFGISGPAVLDISRFWCRAQLENRRTTLAANLLPGYTFESAEARVLDFARAQPRAHLETMLATLLPARVASAVLDHLRMAPAIVMAHLSREDRRRLVHALLDWPLPVCGSRGYGYAEVTAGGVPLDEIDPATMFSRRCAGLQLVGEILDCDGRIGGFNFQWAWATGFVAGRALGRSLKAP